MDVANWVFFGPSRLLAIYPYAGVAIAVAMIGLQACLSWRKGTLLQRNFFREAAVMTGLIWIIFNLYELQFSAILAKSESGSTLRMDLVILIPILYALSVAAILSVIAQLRNGGPK
ncbi:MAG: hypothetical protein ABI583_06690 [Betaproteobacteria bacterium]